MWNKLSKMVMPPKLYTFWHLFSLSSLALLVGSIPVAAAFISHSPKQRSYSIVSTPSSLNMHVLGNDIANDASDNSRKTVIVAGSTGYIGKEVVTVSLSQGYRTVALVRDLKLVDDKLKRRWEGADIVQCNVTDCSEVAKIFQQINCKGPIDAIVSCLASRSGLKRDAYAIDYQATFHCLRAGMDCQARHFVMLSAFCVRKPLLQFQHAKLKFEEQLQLQSHMTWTIVRPTAFFKSVSGQVENVQNGAPFVIFRDGQVTRCNPICERDLAKYLIDCLTNPSHVNRIINIGGPDDPITTREQGEMIFRAAGMPPYYLSAPLWVFDLLVGLFQWLSDCSHSEEWADLAETARIGKYYAVEDMLTTTSEEKFGTVSLQDHYDKLVREGQEYDPFNKNIMSTILIAKNFGWMAKVLQKIPSSGDRVAKVSATKEISLLPSGKTDSY